jgi:hypothetical protein
VFDAREAPNSALRRSIWSLAAVLASPRTPRNHSNVRKTGAAVCATARCNLPGPVHVPPWLDGARFGMAHIALNGVLSGLGSEGTGWGHLVPPRCALSAPCFFLSFLSLVGVFWRLWGFPCAI